MKLIKGQGSPESGACWMSALHYYTRNDRSWTDEAPWACVSPIVRVLCIRLNDLAPDGEREALIGPHLFAPLGTANPAVDRARLVRVVQFALDEAGVRYRLDRDAPDYDAAARAARAAYAAYAAYAAARAADAADAADAAAAAYAAYAADVAADAAYAADAYTAYAAAAARVRLRDLILELCAMGERTETVPTCSREATLAMLER